MLLTLATLALAKSTQAYQIAGGGYGYFYSPPDMRTYATQADAFADFANMMMEDVRKKHW